MPWWWDPKATPRCGVSPVRPSKCTLHMLKLCRDPDVLTAPVQCPCLPAAGLAVKPWEQQGAQRGIRAPQCASRRQHQLGWPVPLVQCGEERGQGWDSAAKPRAGAGGVSGAARRSLHMVRLLLAPGHHSSMLQPLHKHHKSSRAVETWSQWGRGRGAPQHPPPTAAPHPLPPPNHHAVSPQAWPMAS